MALQLQLYAAAVVFGGFCLAIGLILGLAIAIVTIRRSRGK